MWLRTFLIPDVLPHSVRTGDLPGNLLASRFSLSFIRVEIDNMKEIGLSIIRFLLTKSFSFIPQGRSVRPLISDLTSSPRCANNTGATVDICAQIHLFTAAVFNSPVGERNTTCTSCWAVEHCRISGSGRAGEVNEIDVRQYSLTWVCCTILCRYTFIATLDLGPKPAVFDSYSIPGYI